MIKFLIQRPIAVLMTFLAFFILGIITYLNIPISLLPDIPIPEITVNIVGNNIPARDLENTAVSPVRQQLLQVGKLRDMQSETRDGNAIIRLHFEYGVNTDLAFIEVNEKIDASMNSLPRDIQRPHVVKASATDIPVFYLHLTLNSDNTSNKSEEIDFLMMSELAQTIIKRRIEQLPQVAMVDMTGTASKQVRVIPNMHVLQSTGITITDIATELKNNNIEPGATFVRDGHYEYNISFSSVIRTLEDVQHIFLRKNGRLFQLKDIATIAIVQKQPEGIAMYRGKQAVTMGVIKQADENMSALQDELNKTISQLQSAHPHIKFSTSQNQTELLKHIISNLKQNLILAFIFVCIVSIFFMKDLRSPLIIGISMFVSLIISLLFFYLFNISLNIVSLTGLILALGMMIDNSIIVTDNIGQYKRKGLAIDEACITGTNEMITPMLSSSFTTISVFVPLIFMSGIAGALFFDQAFSVTVGLLVSYITGIMLLPVFYKLIYSITPPKFMSGLLSLTKKHKTANQTDETSPLNRAYHRTTNWFFRHKNLSFIVTFLIFPLCILLFIVIPKQKMPDISQEELIVNVDWNENIHLEENRNRSDKFIQALENEVIETAALIGRQQFLLNRRQTQTFSESEIYFRIEDATDIPMLKENINRYMVKNFPKAIVSYAPAGTIFEKIFMTAEPDLRLEYYPRQNIQTIPEDSVLLWKNKIIALTDYSPLTQSYQKQYNLFVNKEKLLLYNISYDNLFLTLQREITQEDVTTLRSYQQYLPITIGKGSHALNSVLNNTLIQVASSQDNERPKEYPLADFISVYPSNGTKTIIAGRNGEFIPFDFHQLTQPEKTWEKLQDNIRPDHERDIHFSGSFFFNRKMMNELIIILGISLLLMYFILAAQFESFVQPLIVLLEIPIAVAAALSLLLLCGHSLNLMSAIGIIVTCGIIINDSILKLDIMNQLRRQGVDLVSAIHQAGQRRLNAILMTSLTSIVCMLPLLFSGDMGSELEKPLAIATIGGMLIGTPVSLFIVPLAYWSIYRNRKTKI